MTYEEKLKLLRSYKKWIEDLEYLENRILRLQSVKYEQNYGGKGKTTNELLDEKTETLRKMKRIELAIYNVDYPYYKRVLESRFLDMLTVKMTAAEMGYCESYIKTLQKRAIQSLKL